MSEMIRRVAVAVRRRKFERTGRLAVFDETNVTAEELDDAKAAIEATREPTPKMINAAAKAMSPEKRPTQEWVSCAQKHKIRYQAMIEEALK